MLTFLLCALALWSWPDEPARRRLFALRGASTRLRNREWVPATRFLPIPAAAVTGGLVAGIGGACAATAVVLLASRTWRSRRAHQHRRDRTARLSAGIRVLVAELRTGAHPAAAAEGAAADGAKEVAGVFADMAATARLGGDVSALLRYQGSWAELREPLARIGRAWALADRYGAALADLLDSVRRDLDHRVAFARDVEAKLAGPRATAAVLAGLPVLGLLMGEVVGSAPLAVLTEGFFGQLLLVVGVGLICAGVVWTRRLTEAVVPL